MFIMEPMKYTAPHHPPVHTEEFTMRPAAGHKASHSLAGLFGAKKRDFSRINKLHGASPWNRIWRGYYKAGEAEN